MKEAKFGNRGRSSGSQTLETVFPQGCAISKQGTEDAVQTREGS